VRKAEAQVRIKEREEEEAKAKKKAKEDKQKAKQAAKDAEAWSKPPSVQADDKTFYDGAAKTGSAYAKTKTLDDPKGDGMLIEEIIEEEAPKQKEPEKVVKSETKSEKKGKDDVRVFESEEELKKAQAVLQAQGYVPVDTGSGKDGSDLPPSAYRPHKKAATKAKDLDAWDKLDYDEELKKVNGDKRAIGELDAKEKSRLEMMKMYTQDPEGTEKAMRQAAQMAALKKGGKGKTNGTKKDESAPKPGGGLSHKANLEAMLKQTGLQGQVFGQDELKTAAGSAKLAEAMAKSAG